MTLLRDVKIEDILPHVLRNDPETLRVVRAIQPLLEDTVRLSDGSDIWSAFVDLPHSLDRLPNLLILDHLAWSLGVETWLESWPPRRKARIIAGVIARKRIAGTIQAVDEIVAKLGHAVEVLPWYRDETGTMDPYTMDIMVSISELESGFSADDQRRMHDGILAAKAARTYYTLSLLRSGAAEIGVFAYARPLVLTRLHAYTAHVDAPPTPPSFLFVNGRFLSVNGKLLEI